MAALVSSAALADAILAIAPLHGDALRIMKCL
jgi:hypothetical protein